MNNKSVLILLFLISSISNKILAQDGMDKPFFDASNSKTVYQQTVEDGPGGPPPGETPIDNYLTIIAIIGLAVGYKKIIKKTNNYNKA
ncbi:hypothetical protein [Flavobacterium sp.]|jgi:hypothetical protein|uniref:hypothetical protein n=1 Tax=Flavobacterium sp. TaxID=239 RepID=UPI0037C09DE7